MFVALEPLGDRRTVRVTERRRRLERAEFIRTLLNECDRRAEKVVLVMDQLHTHSAASLYEASRRPEAERLADLGWRFTARPSTAAG